MIWCCGDYRTGNYCSNCGNDLLNTMSSGSICCGAAWASPSGWNPQGLGNISLSGGFPLVAICGSVPLFSYSGVCICGSISSGSIFPFQLSSGPVCSGGGPLLSTGASGRRNAYAPSPNLTQKIVQQPYISEMNPFYVKRGGAF